jgi:hypothetical protein
MIEKDRIVDVYLRVPEGRRGHVHDFGEMRSFLPSDLHEGVLNLLKDYFRVQLEYEKKHSVSALEMRQGLLRRTGWKEFEAENEVLLATVDIAVRGVSSRLDHNTMTSSLRSLEPLKK